MPNPIPTSASSPLRQRSARRRARRRWVPGFVLLVAALFGAAWILWDPAAGSGSAPVSHVANPEAAASFSARSGNDLPDPSSRPADIEVLPQSEGGAAPALAGANSAGPGAPALVQGRVLDQDDVALPSVTVSLYRGQTKRQASTDAAGSFRFPDLPPGLYRLFVEGHSLPEGFLPPWKQQVAREPEEHPTGIFGTSFRLTAGLERQVDLRVFAAGIASGRIVDTHGAPIAGALIIVRSPSSVTGAAASDDAGRFVIDQLYPGIYTTSVKLGSGLPEAEASAPLPVQFELAPGQTLVLADQVAGSGGHILRGAVVDLAGQPVRGVHIVCREDREDGQGGVWECVTNEAGSFQLGRVPSTALVVEVDTQAGRNARNALAAARIGEAVTPLRLDTRGGREVVDLEVIRVEALRPFRVVGRVRVDPDWAASNGLERWKASVEVHDVDGSGKGSGEAEGEAEDGSLPTESGSPVNSSGAFTWSCATPHTEVELTVVVRGNAGAEVERRQRVQPVADETRELVVSIP